MVHSPPSREAQLQEIASSPVRASISLENGSLILADFSLPHVPTFETEVYDLGGNYGPTMMFGSQVLVPKELRQAGISRRILSAAARVAKIHSVNYIASSVESPHVLRAFRSIFPENALSYNELRQGEDGRHVAMPLPISTDQAIQSLDHATAYEKDPEARKLGFGFEIDLAQVALEGLVVPKITVSQSAWL